MRFGVVGFEADGLLILRHRGRQLALPLESIAQVEVRFGVVGFEADGLLILRHRGRQLTLILQGNAQVVVRFGVVRLEANGLLILCHRCRQLALPMQSIAQVEVRVGIVRLEANGLLILPNCFYQLTLVLECLAQVVMKKRIGRPYPDRLTDILDRQVLLPHLVSKHAQQVQGIGIAGVYLQDLSVDRFRLGQIARLMVAYRQGQSFGNCCHIISFQFSVFSGRLLSVFSQIVSGGLHAPLRRLRVAANR